MLGREKLIGDCQTRWSSTFLMIECFLSIKASLSNVLEQLEWDNLPTSTWKLLENISRLLQPFVQYTSLLSAEEYTSISSVLPVIMELNLHLEEMKKVKEVSKAASSLQVELKHRFRQFTDPGDVQHDPLFLVCTLLDPRYRLLLNNNQTESAKESLLKQLKELSESCESSSSSITQSPKSTPEDSEEQPPKKRFCHLSRLLEQKLREGMKKAAKSPCGEREVRAYLEAVHSLSDQDNPISFGQKMRFKKHIPYCHH